MSNQISATFKTDVATHQFLKELEKIGISDKQISILATDDTVGKSFNVEQSNKLPEGATTGAVTGGIIGAIAGALATATTIAIPGLNVAVTGALAGSLLGLSAGGATGGLVGALIGAGIPEHEAKIYEDEIKNGAILVAVDTKNDEQKDLIEDILNKADAHNIAA